MIRNTTHQDSDANNPNDYFDALRQKNYDATFEGVSSFIEENRNRLHSSRQRKPLRNWQWVLAALLPVLVILACTKTDHTEPVGQAISFSVPVNDAATQALEPIVSGLQTVITPDKQKPGYLSYTSFIPAQGTRSAGAVISQLKGVNGIAGLSTVPVNAQVRASLLSQLGARIFSTHVETSALGDDELQNTINRQLKEKGFNTISVTVIRNENGIRTLQLHPTKDAPNFMIDMSIDDKGTRMVLQEEKRNITGSPGIIERPKVDFGSMTDAEVRDYVRQQYGTQLDDAAIKITRTKEEIAIDIKHSDKREEVLRFSLH